MNKRRNNHEKNQRHPWLCDGGLPAGGLAGCGGQAASGSSGIGSSADSLAEQAGGGAWLEGRRFDSGVPDSELQAWIDGLA